jgi:alkaline phosphatase D
MTATFGRRRLLTAAAALVVLPCPAFARSDRPLIAEGVQSGDVGLGEATLWSRSDRPARLVVEWATTESFRDSKRLVGPAALAETDFTARLRLRSLPAGERIFYRAHFEDLADGSLTSETLLGSFASAPADRRDLSFLWSADTAGQGWGINEDWGGMRIYATMRGLAPDFFVHCGDTIYADGPLQPEVTLPDGTLWRNLVTPEKSRIAQTLDEFRGNHRYNLLDRNLLACNAAVPTVALWSDHEVLDNWYPQEILAGDSRYAEKKVATLAARGRQAFLEYLPVAGERIQRQIAYGPLLDLFVVDTRSTRGRNDAKLGQEEAFFGQPQLHWLLERLKASRATWKVIAADQPIGLLVRDGEKGWDGVANGDGPPRGREREMARLLQGIRDAAVKNVVWLCGDVHYTAAHRYEPDRAQFKDFAPFWEFVSGPLNAGTFGPSDLDDTFGPQVVFARTPPQGQYNLPPSAGLQFFGQVEIEGASGVMTVTLRDLAGAALWSTALVPES